MSRKVELGQTLLQLIGVLQYEIKSLMFTIAKE